MDKKIALVTGASRGIGKAIAEKLVEHNFFVAGTATTKEGADRISKSLQALGDGMGCVMDITDSNSIAEAWKEISEKEGTPSVLVNNAGVTCDNLMMRMKDEEWSKVIDTNLNSLFRMSKCCLRPMIKARWGRIINVSSIVGDTGNAGQANYAAAKAGLIGFTKSLAKEVASRSITVNAVAPGFIETDMTNFLNQEQRKSIMQCIPMQAAGTPDDVAEAVVFLASDSASYITGQTLHVNGGMYMP